MDNKIDAGKATKAMELLARTMKLNENAKPGIYYTFEFSGGTNGVYFSKVRRTGAEFEALVHIYSYLDDNDLGHPLNAVEATIAGEERLLWEEQK